MKSVKNKDKTIAFFTTIPLEFGGGAEILTINTAKAFSLKKNIKVVIYTYKKSVINENPNLIGKLLHKVQYDKASLNGKKRLSLEEVKVKLGKAGYKKLSLFQILRDLKKIDYIFLRSDGPTLLPIFFFVLLNISFRKRIIIQFHTPIKYINNNSFKAIFHNLIYTSFLYKIFVRIISARLQVLNSTDKKYIKRAHLIKAPCEDIFFTSLPANEHLGRKLTVIISGRLSLQKGTDLIPDLLKYLSKKKVLEKFNFIISGSGELEDIAKKSAKRYKNVSYTGNISYDDMPGFLSKGNIFLMLSRYEGSPLSLAEAMAKGLIILAFKIQGIYSKKTMDLINFAEPFSIEEIAERLIELSNQDKTSLMDQSKKNREYAQKEYRMDTYIKKLENLIFS